MIIEEESEDEEDPELSTFTSKRRSKRSFKSRPPAAPFNAKKMHDAGAYTTPDGNFTLCERQRYCRGLLYKVFKLKAVVSSLFTY
jgi:hypothetical protein